MLGINAQTGQPLAGIDHLRQSIRDILTTRIGTRVMRRDYGSRLPALVDNPMTPRLAMDLYSATAETLAEAGFAVTAFAGAASALAALAPDWPGAVLTDIRMPGISGTQLMRLMRSRPDLPSIRYVAYTAHCDPDAAGALESAGFDAVLYKPVTYSQVLQAVLGDVGEH